ncbi:bifunctional glutamate N-acetyltransferase/amino-acid acetyltransferase ArgJ [Marinomonas ostreistagni]|uniref:bifunctional glutamate N-acetyltransferase/amino-acid acetyltransferase ArgJ n=1 Tax=Marinomonas ostreistagni TaxID=359209 RepID=UPI0019528F8F|nr:bifunctional glutamate N-acetyltransferase/amino-acid acetyltransferase ArgJ [Marinomonas ostreistagni]MBM6549758.1 bifunctional glutamate N-acetyltransferase/amino-acid acetyltransferase ArgJ [Marinomonas ostreistagni]
MAVGLGSFPNIPSIPGVRFAAVEAGIKKANKKDVVVFELAQGTNVAGVFTQNQFCAAPVRVCREHLAKAAPRYLVINTGNANAGTGKSGMENALHTCETMAHLTGVANEQILPFSTGVIGEPLPVSKITAALPNALHSLSSDAWQSVGVGIMTTDTLPKGAYRQVELDGVQVTIGGISKGAGMIRPNMATMLGFIFTDAAVDPLALQSLLKQTTEQSFNRITIDSDTSTNDSCIAAATGQAGNAPLTDLTTGAGAVFAAAFLEVMQELAHAIVRDGEGATKFVTVEVKGAKQVSDATKTAFEIAHSPLVKTALFASDPNWGRVLAVVGRAGVEDLNVDTVSLTINGCEIARDGGRSPDYTEEAGQAAMAPEEIHIVVDLGAGEASDTVWTTDFSHEYVTINAEYRT